VLQRFDAQARLVEVAPKASVTCRDADDQKFIDLAVQHQAMLLSKDRAVLCMKKRLLALSVRAQTALDFQP
jgi:predicted nucleic acid-binding protein